MRCKRHPSDLSSSVGVCASCLRDRLFSLVAAQVQHQQQHAHAHAHPPLLFPRSVSPYVSRPKLPHQHLRFYTTPQIAPTYPSSAPYSKKKEKKKKRRFSVCAKLFRSRSEKLIPDPDGNPSEPSSTSSPLWFSTVFSATRNRPSTSRMSSTQYSAKPRGMSPVKTDDNREDGDRSPSSESWKRTPASVRRGKFGNMSVGLSFCLSPLVRASPNPHWNQKAGFPPEFGFSGEARHLSKPHLSMAASFCPNGSRKLVDFGKLNYNR